MEKNFDVFSVASKFYRRNILNRINNTANLSDGVLFRYSTFQIDIAEHAGLWIDIATHCLYSLRCFFNYAIKRLFQQAAKAYYGELLNIKGDQGAKGVLEANIQHLVVVPIIEVAIDIDTPKDLFTVERQGFSSLECLTNT